MSSQTCHSCTAVTTADSTLPDDSQTGEAATVTPLRPLTNLENRMVNMVPQQRIRWSLANLPGQPVLSSSFGAQAAVMLHMLTQVKPDIPVILLDTGYLFAETYQFIDQLHDRLQLNLKVFRADNSAAWQEARYGKLWKQGEAGLNQYNRLNKVEPMRRALQTLQAGIWFSGLRRSQSDSRAATPFADYKPAQESRQALWKIHPIADWNDRDIGLYLQEHDLPYHPLWEQGYVSIGDAHTTRRLADGMRAEDTRFFGLQRECGIHTQI